MGAAEQLRQATDAAWRRGTLSYKLDPHQLALHGKYRRWVAATMGIEVDPEADTMPLVFVADIGRRWGKTWLFILIKFEDCLQRPGSIHTYATAYAKDITEIVIPLADEISADAPGDRAPVFKVATQGQSMSYRFPNGSVLRLVGIDMNPRGLRGRASDGVVISEAGHVKDLEETARAVLLPQFQRKPHARMILESNAPSIIDHDFDTVFIPDAKSRSCESCVGGHKAELCANNDNGCAYQFGTIDDNPVISEQEKNVHLANAGGRNSPRARREYYGERILDRSRAIVPEWSKEHHVRSLEIPSHAVGLMALDPGTRDHMAILAGYLHFELQLAVILRAWARPNASTAEVASAMRAIEAEVFSGLMYWSVNAKQLKHNPLVRASDVNPRFRQDMATEHGMPIAPVNKTGEYGGLQAELKEAGIGSFRTAVGRGQIIADPAAEAFIAQMSAGRWNEQHTDYERNKLYGHFDLIDAGVVFWRTAKQYLGKNPFPPGHLDLPPDSYSKHSVPEQPMTSVAAALEMFGRPSGAPRGKNWRRDSSRAWRRR